MTTPQDAAARIEQTATAEQAARLLGHLRRVLGHDLGNQLVAVQGLLQVLQLEEGKRLSADGQDYLRRAVAAGQRAQATVQTLKELAQIGYPTAPRETIRLDELARELIAEVKTLRPTCTLKWRLGADALRVSVRRHELHQGLRQLVCCLLPPEAPHSLRVEIHSRRSVTRVELAVETVAPTPASSLDWILAQELLSASGATLCVRPEPDQHNLLTLTMPSA